MRTWLALAALLVAVAALGTWIYLKPTPETVATFALSGLKASDVTRVQFERGDTAAGAERSTSTPVALERKEGVWRISVPFSARADAFQLDRLLAILDTRASARFAADDLARYGLDKPAARMTIDDQVFAYGAINTLTREQYVLTNNTVYPIPLSQRTTLPRDAEAMIARTLLAPGEIPVRFAMPGFTMTLTDGRWILDPDSAGVSADERNAWVDGWRNANALRAARARPGAPAVRIGVTLKSGAQIAFGVLQREPELVFVRQDEAIEYAFVPEVGKRLIDPPVRKSNRPMPELPEVETTRRGLAPHLINQRIRTAIVRNGALRMPVPRKLPELVAGSTIRALHRRGKYLLIDCGRGTLIVHLGMSGRLWIVDAPAALDPHDHFDLVLENGRAVRLRDPRRFGLVLWQTGDPLQHPLLANIGPEPLSPEFSGKGLYDATRTRSTPVKLALMDSRVVAGIGNIYASEALFRAGINPKMPAQRIGRARYELLADQIRETLEAAIRAGGSTLRDFVGGDGRAGYFQDEHLVYGRGGEPCTRCGTPVRELRQGQRSTFYCPSCQRR